MVIKMFIIILYSLLRPSQQRVITVDNSNDTLCNQNDSHPYTTLHAALEAVTDNDTIHICNGNYSHNTNTTLPYNDVTITGNGRDVTIVECDNGTGFGFINVSNVSISGLTLSGCGQLRNSTTMNSSSSSVMLFRATLYFENVTSVTIDNVVINNSIGMGVAMYDVTGNVIITNSIFRNNSVPSHEHDIYPGGGGFSVEFTYCTPGIVDNCNSKNTVYLFKNCKFQYNTASTNLRYYATETFGSSNQQFGRGGGLSVFFKGHSLNNTIRITDSVFDDNKAVWGGGFHSDIVDYSTGNLLTLENCNFTKNHCKYNESDLMTTGTGGGGARIAFLFYDPRSNVTNNSVQFIKCKFQFNKAYYGGGLSCRITKEKNVLIASNSLELVDCTWVENIARTGSGVDIISHVFPHGLSPVVNIVNCNFTANNNSYSNLIGYPLGIGALYADNVPVKFSGNCIFDGNKESAIAGMGTYFIFSNDTCVMFSNNNGWHGAGMALLGNAYFIVYHNTSLQFLNNSAVTKGGAIYYINSGQKDFVSTQRCLMYYYDLRVQNHSNWVTKFNFSGNKALLGRSIYCTTLLTCIWGNLPGNVTVTEDDILQVFNWSGIFYYDGEYNRSEEIATDTANINISISERIKVSPGKSYHLNIAPTDDRGQATYPVIYGHANDSNTFISVVADELGYSFVVRGNISSRISISLYTLYNRPYVGTINVTIDKCPPGFHYPYNEGGEKVCECPTSTSENLYGITDCNSKQLIAYLNPQFWAGYIDLEQKEMLMTSDCPKDYCIDTRVELPANSSHEALDTLVCSHHRTGDVCGKCQNGYYVYINSPSYHCGSCDDTLSQHGYLILIVSKYLPLTLMMCFIIFFDISLVDGPLNSFILFSQIVGALQIYAAGKIRLSSGFASILINILKCLYGIWNLQFFEFLLPSFCVFKHNNSMVSILAEYTPAFYLLLLCFVIFFVLPWIFHVCAQSRVSVIRNCALKVERIFIRVRHRWSVANSVVHGLTTFLVLSYARITLTTFKFLSLVTLYGSGGQDSHYSKRVVWYDGTMSYFGHEHFPYAIIAIFMFIIFVLIPPLLLLSYPLLPVLMTRLRVEDYWIVRKLITNPLSKCVPIFDAFQSCYKDEYRFFAGLLFVYRIIALGIQGLLPTTTASIYIWMQLFFLSILLLHCICQPYKQKWHNVIEALTFTLLASIIAISSYRLFEAETSQTQTDNFFWIQVILLYCPLVYFIVFVTYKVIKWLYPHMKYLFNKTRCNVWRNNSLLRSYEFPARMDDEGDNYSSTSESDQSTVPDDEQETEDEQDENDVEMIHPAEWNDDIGRQRVPCHKSDYSSREWVTQ